MRQILVLGAGKSAGYLIHKLLEDAVDEDWFVTVGDVDLATARECVKNHPRGTAIEFDVNDSSHRETQIANSDVVVNMLAPAFQGMLAVDCIHSGKPLVSVSYQDQVIRDLGPDAHRKGVLLLTELGLDPGIDHMSAMAMIQKIRSEGGRVRLFCSYGSGVPAADEPSNPLRYVITWNPRNVVMGGEDGAQYLEDGRIKIVPHHEVFHHTWPVEVPGIGTMEAYPNRDSLSYMETFGLDDVRTMVRGTLRYPGWSETWAQIVKLGLPNETIRISDLSDRTYREVIEMFLPTNNEDPEIEQRLARYLRISPTGQIMEKLRWLGLFSEEKTGCDGETAARMMAELIQRKLPLEKGRRDTVILLHKLEVDYPGTDREPERILSTMICNGEPNGFTAMSKTVGLPTAIAVRLLLRGEIPLSGAAIPTHPSIYTPILEELQEEGIAFTETTEPITRG